jgi:hypothetical protein
MLTFQRSPEGSRGLLLASFSHEPYVIIYARTDTQNPVPAMTFIGFRNALPCIIAINLLLPTVLFLLVLVIAKIK